MVKLTYYWLSFSVDGKLGTGSQLSGHPSKKRKTAQDIDFAHFLSSGGVCGFLRSLEFFL